MMNVFLKANKYFLPVISGVLMTASFPKAGLGWIAWTAFVPLLYSLRDKTARESFIAGMAAGMAHFLTLLYWLVPTMHTYGYLPFYQCIPILFLFAVYLALYPAFFSAGVSMFAKTPYTLFVFSPALWVATEFVRTFLFTGFPWELTGYSQYLFPEIIQMADITGVYGVSFILVLFNTGLFIFFAGLKKERWQGAVIRKHHVVSVVCMLFFALSAVWGYGRYSIAKIERAESGAPSAAITVVQGNIPQASKWDQAYKEETVNTYVSLSQPADNGTPGLVVWPETAMPFYLNYEKKLTRMVLDAAADAGTHFLVGSPSFIRGDRQISYLNTAWLVQPDGTVGDYYSKVHLVPFGEYVPLKKYLPFIGKMVAQVGDFKPGIAGSTLRWNDAEIGVQICYEVIFPELSRLLVKNGAGIIVNITNDAWFGTTGGPYQHFSMSVFRAVENRRALARSANTGISGFVGPAGEIIATTSLNRRTSLTKKVPLLTTDTLYTRYGDFFASFCLAVCLIFILKKCIIRSKPQ